MNFKQFEYREEIKSLAAEVTKKVEIEDEDQNDAALYLLENHEYILYTGNCLTVLFHSNNDGALFEEGETLEAEDAFSVYQRMAKAAMYQDLMEELEN